MVERPRGNSTSCACLLCDADVVEIKNQWARDDPAFVVLLFFLCTFSLIAYWLALAQELTLQTYITHVLVPALIYFVLFGIGIAGGMCWFLNSRMRVQRVYVHELQRVEILHALDVHFNSVLPAFCLLGPLQYCLLPVLLTSSFLSTVAANTLYTASVCYYIYITFLCYNALPFLDRAERLLYPAAPILFLYIITLLLNVNLSNFFLHHYYA